MISVKNFYIPFFLGVLVTFLFITFFYGIGSKGKYQKLTAKQWYAAYSDCRIVGMESNLNFGRIKEALQIANQNINNINDKIEDAKKYTWSDYEEMGNALESLETAKTVSENYIPF